jgi:hypothetical protein
MKITIARLGAPADGAGNVIAMGAIEVRGAVPLLDAFDWFVPPIGQAIVHADGSADLELREGVELDVANLEADGTIGIGYRALEWTEADGIRTITRLEVLAVGVSRDLIRRRS